MPAPLYPWGLWFSRPRVVLRRGRDYGCPQGAFAQQIRNAARLHRVGVSLEEGEDCYVITVTERRSHAAAR